MPFKITGFLFFLKILLVGKKGLLQKRRNWWSFIKILWKRLLISTPLILLSWLENPWVQGINLWEFGSVDMTCKWFRSVFYIANPWCSILLFLCLNFLSSIYARSQITMVCCGCVLDFLMRLPSYSNKGST
jgi:hypothetical protein